MSTEHLPKVAICISGVPRGTYCTELVKRISQHNNTHVFIWYWNDGNEILQKHSRRYTYPEPFDPQIYQMPGVTVIHASDTFQKYEEHFRTLKNQLPRFDIDRQDLGIYGMTYAIKMANELRESYERSHGFVFDCVARARFESRFAPPGSTNYDPEAKLLVSDYDFTNTIYTSHTNVDIKYGMNDCMAFSNSENMSKYSKVFENMYELSSIEGHSPEKIFYHNITKYNLGKKEQYILVGF
jgi:hypothetical protein